MICFDHLVMERGGRLVLDQVTLTADNGEIVGIIGPNGAGKTTLLAAGYRALPWTSGEVVYDGESIATLTRGAIARRVAVVAQDPEPGLPLSVRELVGLGRLAHRNLLGYGDAADQEATTAALLQVGASHLADRLATELSGGERQRVLIARAIVQRAPYLLLDEPTNHLDIHHQFAVLNLVASLSTTTMLVLHDLNLAARYCDALVLLGDGQVVASGTPADVLRPDILESVYRVGVQRLEMDGKIHLLFEPKEYHD